MIRTHIQRQIYYTFGLPADRGRLARGQLGPEWYIPRYGKGSPAGGRCRAPRIYSREGS